MIRRIKNTLHLLNAFIANLYFGFPGRELTVIGITGTDGKTTTTHITYEILKQSDISVSMISSVYAVIGGKEYDTGFHVTTPNPWFLQKMLKKARVAGDTHIVLETTSHGLDQNRVWGIPFNIGIVTNITNEHLDYHHSYEAYLKSKLKLLEQAQIGIVNREDASFQNISKWAKTNGKKIITYGLKKGDITLSSFSFTTTLPGEYNKSNILAAYSAAKQEGVSEINAQKAIKQFKGIKGRFDEIKTPYGFNVVIDFAHTSNGLKQVLSTVSKKTTGRVIHVFGCAGLRDYKKRPVMGGLSSKNADIIILTEEDYRTEEFDSIVEQIKRGIRRTQNVYVYKSRQDAINFATSLAKRGDVVLLTGKGHEKSLCRGKIEYPWDEHLAVKKALKKRSKRKKT